MAAYRADETWNAKLPAVNLRVPNGGLIAATPEAEVALWRYLMSVDWVARVKTGLRAPDDIVPLLLGDPRAARTGPQSDLMWLRFLDTPRALSARTYAAPGTLVLDVDDPMGLAGGRYRLEALPDSTATCAPTDDPADLTLSMSGLGALYLGDESAVRLATLGRASEARPGAAACADLLFRTSRRPWCPDIF
jgi:predicted acetyltransferase